MKRAQIFANFYYAFPFPEFSFNHVNLKLIWNELIINKKCDV